MIQARVVCQIHRHGQITIGSGSLQQLARSWKSTWQVECRPESRSRCLNTWTRPSISKWSPPVKAGAAVGGIVGVVYLIKPLTIIIASSAGAWALFHLVQRYYRQINPISSEVGSSSLPASSLRKGSARQWVGTLLQSFLRRQQTVADMTRKEAIHVLRETLMDSPGGLVASAIMGKHRVTQEAISRLSFSEPTRIVTSSSSFSTFSMTGLGSQSKNQTAEVEFQVALSPPPSEPWEGISTGRMPSSCIVRAAGTTSHQAGDGKIFLEEFELYDPQNERWISIKAPDPVHQPSFRDWLPGAKQRTNNDVRDRLRIRRFSTVTPHFGTQAAPKGPTACFVCQSYDPWLNLALEDWIFKSADIDTFVLVIYTNSECVVIGRNQNPWTEAPPKLLAAADPPIPLIRRRSGGGTVFHDLGNTNYSIMMPKEAFTRQRGAQIVVDALHSTGPGLAAVRLNERHDIVLDGYKISGSAYKITSKRAYHHGTLLFDADLDRLRKVLHPIATPGRGARDKIDSKGVQSVRSPVTNISTKKDVKREDFIEALIRTFKANFSNGTMADFRSDMPWPKDMERKSARYGMESAIVLDEQFRKVSTVGAGEEELKSWDWTFGQTPQFIHCLMLANGDTIEVQTRHARIEDIHYKGQHEPSGLSSLKTTVIGSEYESGLLQLHKMFELQSH